MCNLTVYTNIRGFRNIQKGAPFYGWITEQAVRQQGEEPFQIAIPVSAVVDLFDNGEGYKVFVTEKANW